jgi:hypothetical protein
MSGLNQAHEVLINSVAERYRRDGYEVAADPGPGAVPFDLGGYRPDIVARKGDHALIIEVKTQVRRTSFDQLRSIVDEIKRHAGWRFVLITGQDVVDLASPAENEDQVSWEVIANSIEHADRLSRLGEDEAAYLVLWIAFERMMRYEANRVGLPLDRLAPQILIRQLYSQGELTMAQFDSALELQESRNRVVHGFRVSRVKAHLEHLRALVSELLSQWLGPSVETEDLST